MSANLSVPLIIGPTASGKTSVGIELARLLNGEVISVDSRKIYRGLPVGTATPPGEIDGDCYRVEGIPHYFIAQLDPRVPYTAGDFAREAEERITEIKSRGKRPILVGGTGFYFKSLADGLPPLPPRDLGLRAVLEKRIEVEGVDALHRELAAVDGPSAAAIAANDWHKVVRALEVTRITGRPFSEWKGERRPSAHRYVAMGLDSPRPFLDRRIDDRSRTMAEHGMIEETAALLESGAPADCPALDSFGYREAVQVVRGQMDRSAFLLALIKGTKAYAKRQRTWFRTQMKPAWFRTDETTRIKDISLNMKAFLEGAAS